MNNTFSKRLRFSDAVYAIQTTPKALRLWLQRGLVKLHSVPQEEGGWSEYSFLDIGILALTRKLADFGVPIATASQIANFAMTRVFPRVLDDNASLPATALALMWSNRRLQIFHEDGDWQMKVVALWESDLSRIRDEDFDPEMPSGVSSLRREIEPSNAYLTLDVEALLRGAFARATESANEGFEE
jgi:hypothetical protein